MVQENYFGGARVQTQQQAPQINTSIDTTKSPEEQLKQQVEILKQQKAQLESIKQPQSRFGARISPQQRQQIKEAQAYKENIDKSLIEIVKASPENAPKEYVDLTYNELLSKVNPVVPEKYSFIAETLSLANKAL